MQKSGPKVIVLANCTHASIAMALRISKFFSIVDSAELYSMARERFEAFSKQLRRYDYILTIEHGAAFGPLATSALRAQLSEKVISLPTPFFSGLTPDMAYLKYDNDIARTEAVLGDYHSALILEDLRSGYSKQETIDRYTSGASFERLDVEGVWSDNLSELRSREAEADISISSYIEKCALSGTISREFLSFNHPKEGLINHIARSFIQKVFQIDFTGNLLKREDHNLYSDAFWPMHPVVGERLGLPKSDFDLYKQPKRIGGAYLSISEFAQRSVNFLSNDKDLTKFAIVTPAFLPSRIRPRLVTNQPRLRLEDKPRQIVMTHFGRSGSTVLAELLKQHNRIAWLDEYFSLKWIRSSETYDYTLDQLIAMVGQEVAILRARLGNVFVGHEIKLMNFLQNPSCNMVDYARATSDSSQYVHIVLRRRNVLKRICSSYKAAQTKVYHVRSDDAIYRKKTFSIDFSNLRDYDTGQSAENFPDLIDKVIARENSVLTNYKNLGISYLELFYEDDIESDPRVAYRKIISHIGLEYQSADVLLNKTSNQLSRDLENFDVLLSQISNSKYAWMLD